MNLVDKLLVVQDVDCKIRDIEREIKDIPLRKKQELSRLDEHRKALADVETGMKQQQTETKRLEGEIGGLREKIAKFRQQQMQLKTNDEFRAMEKEIKAVERGITDVEDNEIIAMEAIEAAKIVVAEKKQILAREEGVMSGALKVSDARLVEIEGHLKELREQRQKVAADVDRIVLSRYEQVFSRRDKAVVKVRDGVCGGCHMKLPPATIHSAHTHTTVVSCEFCGRMLA